MIRRTRRGNILTNRHVQSINCWLYFPVGTPNAFSPELPASYGLQAASVLSTGRDHPETGVPDPACSHTAMAHCVGKLRSCVERGGIRTVRRALCRALHTGREPCAMPESPQREGNQTAARNNQRDRSIRPELAHWTGEVGRQVQRSKQHCSPRMCIRRSLACLNTWSVLNGT